MPTYIYQNNHISKQTNIFIFIIIIGINNKTRKKTLLKRFKIQRGSLYVKCDTGKETSDIVVALPVLNVMCQLAPS